MCSKPCLHSTKKEQNFTVYDTVRKFEETIAEYTGAPYAVAVSSCTNAIFLSCLYKRVRVVRIPRFTYPGVAASIKHAGAKILWRDKRFQSFKGMYELFPSGIYDCALRFKKDMYKRKMYNNGNMMCLSFHVKKHIPIGRGGMVLVDNKRAYNWLKQMRFDGRHECALQDDDINLLGYNMYMTPEQAVRGLMLFDLIKDKELDDLDSQKQCYPDLSAIKVYNE
jgi:dTDP-4-amino-4,6-dideoxygalactose transaminase